MAAWYLLVTFLAGWMVMVCVEGATSRHLSPIARSILWACATLNVFTGVSHFVLFVRALW